jgi:hypothetical protein
MIEGYGGHKFESVTMRSITPAEFLGSENAEDVWKELPNSKVASAYVQAYRIADKVIQAKGDNEFLGSGGNIHCGIRNDFKFTANGLERKDKKTISAPNN